MRNGWYAGVLLLCTLAMDGNVVAQPAAPQLVNEQKATPGSLAIPYQRYRLANGLTLILSPDHSDPLVHVNVAYHVGSSREQQGITGFAHFFEHMMFQGSKHVGDQQHFKLIEEAGGTLNGATGQDVTNYYETVPANELEKVLWLESDRMGFLLEAVSQKKFEIQRATVKNERGQRVDNQPYGRVREVQGESLFPRTHPYSWQPIGYVEDLDRVDVSDLKRFFLRWYGPNNATLTIGGDFQPEQALKLVEHYFGGIPAGPEVKPLPLQPVSLSADRYVTLEDNIQLPLLLITYPTPVKPGSAEESALDIAAEQLAGSKNSLFYQQLVKPGLALDADATFFCRELSCELQIVVQPNPVKLQSLKPLAQKVRELLGEFARQGVSEQDLTRIKGSLKAEAVWRLESVSGKVNQLSYGQVLFGDPNASLAALQRLAQISREQVSTSFATYLANKPALWLSVIPKGQSQWQVAPANYQPEPRKPMAGHQEGEVVLRPVKDGVKRDTAPVSGGAVAPIIPTLWHETLPGNIQVSGVENQEIPAVSITITLPGGRRVETPAKAGLASLTAAMVRQGSKRLSTEALSEELQRLGSSISFSAASYNTVVKVSSLSENLPKTLQLLEELLRSAGLRESDFARIKNQTLQGLRQQAEEPSAMADRVFYPLIYGANSPLALPDDGTLASVSALTLQDVQAYYRDYYFPANGKVIVVGDVDSKQLMPLLAFLGKVQGEARHLPNLKPTAPEAKGGLYLVDLPGAVQSTLRIGRRALPYDIAGDYLLANVMNFNFAGNFNSRVNQLLREKKGYTYGASCDFSGNRDTGDFVCSSDVRADATADAIQLLLQQMQGYHSGPDDKELAYLKSAFSRQDALSYETLGQKAGFLLNLALMGETPDAVLRQQAKVAGVSRELLAKESSRWLRPEEMKIVVVGDAKRLEPALKALKLPITRVDAGLARSSHTDH